MEYTLTSFILKFTHLTQKQLTFIVKINELLVMWARLSLSHGPLFCGGV